MIRRATDPGDAVVLGMAALSWGCLCEWERQSRCPMHGATAGQAPSKTGYDEDQLRRVIVFRSLVVLDLVRRAIAHVDASQSPDLFDALVDAEQRAEEQIPEGDLSRDLGERVCACPLGDQGSDRRFHRSHCPYSRIGQIQAGGGGRDV